MGDEKTTQYKKSAYTKIPRYPTQNVCVRRDDCKHRDRAQAIEGGEMRPRDDVAKEGAA